MSEWLINNKVLQQKARERRTKVYGLHLSGKSFEEIGRELGINKQRAYQLYRKAKSDIEYNILNGQLYWMKRHEKNPDSDTATRSL